MGLFILILGPLYLEEYENKGEIIVGPGLPLTSEKTMDFISSDCVAMPKNYREYY